MLADRYSFPAGNSLCCKPCLFVPVQFFRSDLEDRIYGWGEEVESNAVDFLIHAAAQETRK